MKISKQLNLVVPVDSRGEKAFLHSMPIPREVFQKYHFVICAAFTRLMLAGMEMTAPKIAAMTLQEIAEEQGKWESTREGGKIVGTPGVKDGLMEEIARLTNVMAFVEGRWDMLPVMDAIARDLIDEEDWEEGKQRIVFFILTCAMTREAVRNDLLQIAAESWQLQITSLNCTEYAASLPKLTEIETLPKEGKAL